MGKEVVPFRSVSYLVLQYRIFLLGHDRHSYLRNPAYVAPRTQCPPQIPKNKKISDNYYHGRNPTCSFRPPLVMNLYEDATKKITEAKYKTSVSKDGSTVCTIGPDKDFKRPIRPGTAHLWDGHSFYTGCAK